MPENIHENPREQENNLNARTFLIDASLVVVKLCVPPQSRHDT